MDTDKLLALPQYFLERLPVTWTYLLLVCRVAGLFITLPGLSFGLQGLALRTPAILVIAAALLVGIEQTPLPSNILLVAVMCLSEIVFGALLGVIPLIVVAGAQHAGQLASTTMGLGAGALIDPTSQTMIPQLGKLFGDFTVLTFLLIDGYHVFLYSLSGASATVQPGFFLSGASLGSGETLEILVTQTSTVFSAGVIMSAPVVVALLLTQFVMGIMTRVVSQLNIFVVSFPLTVGVGLFLSVAMLPGIVTLSKSAFRGSEKIISELLSSSGVLKPSKNTF